MKHAAATLGSGNLRQAVVLPEGEDLNEWVAVNSEYLVAKHNLTYVIEERQRQINSLIIGCMLLTIDVFLVRIWVHL